MNAEEIRDALAEQVRDTLRTVAEFIGPMDDTADKVVKMSTDLLVAMILDRPEFAPGLVLIIGERVPADAMNGHDMALALAEVLRGDGGGMNGHTVAAEMLEFIAPQLLFRAVTAEEADDE